jgi:polysaccharide chain length determinant protein (PEP-CTERM system associated)
MQPTEGFSIPRRTLDIEDYIDIVRRHKGWIFGPFLFTLVASVVGVYAWPDSYSSREVIRIVPQQVPQSMVQNAVNQEMTDRIISMAQTIESRVVLTNIINTFGLYPKDLRRIPIEDVIDEMKKKIIIAPSTSAGGAGRQVPAFVIEFSYENRILAQRVVEDLGSRFIDENQRNRTNATSATTLFLKDQTEQNKKALDEVENKLTTFRVQNNGRLPDQVETNRQQLNTLQANSTYYSNGLARATADRLLFESQLSSLNDRLTALSKETQEVAAVVTPKSERLNDVDHEIDALQNNLRLLRQQYTETFPDVVAAVGQLATFQKKRDEIVKEEAADAEARRAAGAGRSQTSPQAARELLDLRERIRATQSLIEAKQVEIDQANKDLKRSNELINQYQARIETIPLGQKEFDDLLRERDMAKEKYQEMDGKLAKAQTAEEMESRKQGETLEILDPASVSQNPTYPNRPLVISVGAAIGLLLGILIAAAREMKDTSLKNLKDVRAYTQMAILGSIPLLENDFVVRRRRRLAWLGWTTACFAAVVVMTGSIVYYNVTKI